MRAPCRDFPLLLGLLLLLMGTWPSVRAGGNGPWAAPCVFTSSAQTGTGSVQTIAHGLGSTPRVVLVSMRKLPALAGILTTASTLYTLGTHDSTSVRVTALSGAEYYVLAIP